MDNMETQSYDYQEAYQNAPCAFPVTAAASPAESTAPTMYFSPQWPVPEQEIPATQPSPPLTSGISHDNMLQLGSLLSDVSPSGKGSEGEEEIPPTQPSPPSAKGQRGGNEGCVTQDSKEPAVAATIASKMLPPSVTPKKAKRKNPTGPKTPEPLEQKQGVLPQPLEDVQDLALTPELLSAQDRI